MQFLGFNFIFAHIMFVYIIGKIVLFSVSDMFACMFVKSLKGKGFRRRCSTYKKIRNNDSNVDYFHGRLWTPPYTFVYIGA